MERRIDSILAEYESLQKEILEIIGYGGHDASPILFDPNIEWVGNGDMIALANQKTGFEDPHYYTISSLGAKGEKLYMGEKEGLFFFMAYDTFDDDWRNTELVILSASKRRFDVDFDY